jgi:broad specificity phosphatase PhoE
MNVARITLVRHGETTGQSSVRYYGRTDLPLSEHGMRQMERTRDALLGERFGAVFSSRLVRSRVGAALVAGNGHVVTPIAAFDEVDFGRWEGWTREEIEMRDPEAYRRWRADGRSFTYPEGESRPAFEARVVAGFEELLRAPVADHVLMVLHRGVIAVILTHLLELTAETRARLGIDLGSIHVVARANGGWWAESLDRTDHLGAAEHAPAHPEPFDFAQDKVLEG